MEPTTYYSIVFYILLVASLLTWPFGRFALPYLRAAAARRVVVPLLTRRRWGTRATRLQALFLLAYLAANFLVLLVPFRPLPELREIEKRAGIAAVVNLLPLSLVGRTNIVADLGNISLTSSALAHHWVGRAAAVQGIIHASAVLRLRPRPGAITASGYTTSAGLAAVLLLSLFFCRRVLAGFFAITHSVLAMVVFGGAAWHVFELPRDPSGLARPLVLVTCSLWLISSLHRALRWTYPRTTAKVVKMDEDNEVAIITVACKEAVHAAAYSYFFVYFPGLPIPSIDGHPMKPLSYGHVPPTDGVVEMTFLMSLAGKHAGRLARLQVGDQLRLCGPYGHNPELDTYEEVILVAKGIGIVGVLPFAFHFAERKKYDAGIRKELRNLRSEEKRLADEVPGASISRRRKLDDKIKSLRGQSTSLNRLELYRDKTQRVDLLWLLEHESQERWIAGSLRKLQSLDPDNKVLVVWCVYPSKRDNRSPAPFEESAYWKSIGTVQGQLDPEARIAARIREKSARTSGSVVVVACGDADFTERMRDGVCGASSGKSSVSFVEAEFLPGERPTGWPGKRGSRKSVDSRV